MEITHNYCPHFIKNHLELIGLPEGLPEGSPWSKDLSKSQRASKSDQCFKSYGHFTEGVDFACWCNFSGGGSAINGATPSSF